MKIAVMDFSNMGRWFSSLAYPCLPFCEKLQESTTPTTQFAISTSTTDQVQNTLGNGCASPWVQLSDSCYLEALEKVGYFPATRRALKSSKLRYEFGSDPLCESILVSDDGSH